MRCLLLAIILIGPAAPLVAQTDTAIARAAETILAADITRHVGVIADDSMLGRDTPSRGLDRSARYVAEQFAKLGLKTYFARYPIPGQLRVNYAESRIGLSTVITTAKRQTDIITEDGGSISKQAFVGLDFTRFAAGRVPESGPGPRPASWFPGITPSSPLGGLKPMYGTRS